MTCCDKNIGLSCNCCRNNLDLEVPRLTADAVTQAGRKRCLSFKHFLCHPLISVKNQGASWGIYRKQIVAGINFCISGIPYWTFDIGAFVLGAYSGVFFNGGKDPAYQELYARMFQFGAFCPIFRAHGSETPREIWEFGEFSEAMLKFDHLRYRLLPYIYSIAWQVTNDGYTIMRGLPMDFMEDVKTYSIDDQFMFGPAMMVCPVTEYMIHKPLENSIIVTPEHFRTKDGKPGVHAKYYKDPGHKTCPTSR